MMYVLTILKIFLIHSLQLLINEPLIRGLSYKASDGLSHLTSDVALGLFLGLDFLIRTSFLVAAEEILVIMDEQLILTLLLMLSVIGKIILLLCLMSIVV